MQRPTAYDNPEASQQRHAHALEQPSGKVILVSADHQPPKTAGGYRKLPFCAEAGNRFLVVNTSDNCTVVTLLVRLGLERLT